MPDLATIAEAGVPGYAARPWFSVVAPAGTPRPIIDRLNALLIAFIRLPDTQDKMDALAITPWTSTPDELARFIPAEIETSKDASTVNAVTFAPTALARANPCRTALPASSEPSVGIKIWRYMPSSQSRPCHHTCSILSESFSIYRDKVGGRRAPSSPPRSSCGVPHRPR